MPATEVLKNRPNYFPSTISKGEQTKQDLILRLGAVRLLLVKSDSHHTARHRHFSGANFRGANFVAPDSFLVFK